MIKVIIGNNILRQTMIFPADMTLKNALEQAEVDYSLGILHLDGAALGVGELNKTFFDFGYDGSQGKDKCFLINVVKADNA